MSQSRLIVDPWRELHEERKRHQRTLFLLEGFSQRSAIPTAAGTMSEHFCRLCERVPATVNPMTWRAGCPCRTARAHIVAAREALAVTIKVPRQAKSSGSPDAEDE